MVPLTKDVTTIGRKLADIILDDTKISSTHAEVLREGAQFFIHDLKSTNGTHLNRKLVKKAELTDQDLIEIGTTTLCFYLDSREFHGVKNPSVSRRVKVDSENTKTAEMVTTTKTLRQMPVKFKVTLGPDEGKKFSFKKSHILIGRKDADLPLLDVDISRSHALVEVLGETSIFLRDLESTNGTYLNGRKILCERLSTGDEIGVGNTKIMVALD